MIILYSYLQLQFKNDLFHILHIIRAKCWVTGRQFILKNIILMILCFVDLIGTAPSPVANNIAAVDPGAGGSLLVDVFDMPAVPSIGGGGIPSVTPGAEENLKK